MPYRISPLWWPLMILLSPFIGFFIIRKNRSYIRNRNLAEEENKIRIDSAAKMELPELEFLEMTILVEEKFKEGFKGDARVSYLFRSNLGTLLYDVGFGDDRPSFVHNVKKLGIDVNSIDAFAISHLHLDHMGGMEAHKRRNVKIPGLKSSGKTCYVPDTATCDNAEVEIVNHPTILKAGIASTGPLARSLFFLGYTEEQSLVANIKDKGLVIITGCGHPKIEVILKMVKKMSDLSVYAAGGGLHFPVTDGRGNRIGIKFQTILGTGKPPWKKINEKDLLSSANAINRSSPEKVYISGHDSCDYSLDLLKEKLNAETIILEAGETYRF